MRHDQFERLSALEEKLLDVFLDEGEPDHWPGAGMSTQEWRELEKIDPKRAQQIRGDRYWSKKGAAATLVLCKNVQHLITTTQGAPVAPDAETGEPALDMDQEIELAEREAKRHLDEVERQRKKAEFDTRTHGRRSTH